MEIFNKRATEYAEKFMDQSLYHDTFDLFCKHLPQGAEMLEIACGPGNITKYLLSKRPDLDILAIDLAPKMLDLASENNPGAEIILLDGRKINLLKRKFSGILCGFFLPYLTKEECLKFIHDAETLLTPGGVLYLSTMEDSYSKSGFYTGCYGDKMYMHYHEANYLEGEIKRCGMTIVKSYRKDYKPDSGLASTDLVIIAEKKQN